MTRVRDFVRDHLLLERLRSGDAEAFEVWVAREKPRAMATARRMLRDEAASEDVVQDAFMNAFRALPRFSGKSCLSTWLHRIVVNCALMHLRRQRRARLELTAAPVEAYLESKSAETACKSDALEHADAVAHNELCRIIEASYARLSEPHRTVLRLRDVEGLDTRSTALVLGIRSEAVKMRVHRARQALRACVEAYLSHGQMQTPAMGAR